MKEVPKSLSPQELTAKEKISRIHTCQKYVDKWVHSEWSSYKAIPMLYTALFHGEAVSPDDPDAPSMHKITRTTDIRISSQPRNFCVPGTHVGLLVGKYCDLVDGMLRETPKTFEGENVDKVVENASKAYYIFERLHPLPDGNGRVGRMTHKRITKGAGLREIVFQDPRWYKYDKSPHVDALGRVDETGNLAHLDLYFLTALARRYDPKHDKRDYDAIQELIIKKEGEAKKNGNKRPLSDLWDGFRDVPMLGN